MSTNDILKFYEEVKDDLKFQNTSSVRTKILISLSEGPKKTKDLRKIIGIQSSTILHGIRELEKQNLISSNGDDFFLSGLGKIMTLKTINMIKTSVSLKNFHELWFDHEIDAIPTKLLKDIGDLSNSKLIEADNTDFFKTHGVQMEIALESMKLRGISHIFHPDYIETFNSILNKNVDVELILTENILKKAIESHDPERLNDIKTLISKKQLKLWETKEDIKIAFAVTDKTMTLGLFSKKGMYDSTKILVSDHEDALAWGNRLFEYYLKQASRINLDYFELF